MMTEFKFIEGDPPSIQGHSKLAAFAEALRANPGKWAEYPTAVTPAVGRNYSAEINKASQKAPKSFQGGGFEATAPKGVLYVRFIGGES